MFVYYKVIIAYDGTDYHGWQFQPDRISVSGILQERFKAIFKQSIKIVGASRTDTGVHALGQVASFGTYLNIEPEKLAWAWNNLLPQNVFVRSIERVTEEFHPQRSVEQKTYYYHIFKQRPLPMLARYGYYPKYDLCPEKLKTCLSIFIGTHDFRSFCTGYDQENTVRTINTIELDYFKRYGVYRIKVVGPGFLRYMIRRIVGACIDIASSNRYLDELSIALAEKNPHQHLLTAPAQGLMLYKIKYKN